MAKQPSQRVRALVWCHARAKRTIGGPRATSSYTSRCARVCAMLGLSSVLMGCGALDVGRPPARQRLSVSGPASGRVYQEIPARNIVLRAAARANQRIDGLSGGRVRFRDTQRIAAIYEAGSSHPFVLFETTRYDASVGLSGAMVRETANGPPRFARAVDRLNWMADGSRLSLATPGTHVVRYAPGDFSFIPQGRTLSYDAVRELRGAPAVVRAAVDAHLAPPRGPAPPPTVALTAYGWLLAAAPVASSVRAALFTAIAAIPGLRVCGIHGPDELAVRRGSSVCVAGGNFETELAFDAQTGSVVMVVQRVRVRSPAFADLPGGTAIQSDTFVAHA